MQNAGWRQSSHMLPPSSHMSIKKLPISLEKWQWLVQKEIPSLLAPIHCSYTAHNTLCHCTQYCDPAWRDNPDWVIETGHPDRGLQLVALRVHSYCELPMNTRHVASVILPTSPIGVPHCSGPPYRPLPSTSYHLVGISRCWSLDKFWFPLMIPLWYKY